jgi:hypothetical protein
MIVHDLNVDDIAVIPAEAYTPLVVDPYAPLLPSVPFQSLQPVAERIAQVGHRQGGIDLAQLSQCSFLDVARKSSAFMTLPKALGFATTERADHGFLI